MAYRHFRHRLETVPPLVSEKYHIPRRRVNIDNNASKCAITGNAIFNSECTRNRLSTELRPGLLGSYSALGLLSWIWGEDLPGRGMTEKEFRKW